MNSPETDIERMEGKGALNFLAIDDLSIAEEGEPIEPKSIIAMKFINDKPSFPKIKHSGEDDFLKRIHKGQKKWIVLTDEKGLPKLTLDSNAFLRSALFEKKSFNPMDFCHRPVVIRHEETTLGDAII